MIACTTFCAPLLIQILTHVYYSYAEMPKSVKNQISHRGKALALVKEHFAAANYKVQNDGSA